MPRMARVVLPDYPHHVTQRGNRRQRVFFQDQDWCNYLALVRAACIEASTKILAYCLMPNHVHFLLVPTHEDGLRAAMADAHRRYTRQVNFREGWRGHLWQDRFHSFVMDGPHLRAAIPYVEENPVRARLCGQAADWRWSSAAEAEGRSPETMVDWDLRERLVEASIHGDTTGPGDPVDAIRLHTRTGRPLGADAFVQRVEIAAGRCLRPRKRGRKPNSP